MAVGRGDGTTTGTDGTTVGIDGALKRKVGTDVGTNSGDGHTDVGTMDRKGNVWGRLRAKSGSLKQKEGTGKVGDGETCGGQWTRTGRSCELEPKGT